MKIIPWKIVNSRYIVDDRWLKLRADDCLTSLGKSISPYYVLEYPPWVSVVALTPEKDIVVIRQYRHGIRQFILEIPGGAVEDDDDSIFAAARRELKEETGYQAENFTEIGNISANPVNHTNDIYFFLAVNALKVSEPTPELTEQIEVLRIPLNELVEKVYKGELRHPHHVAALFFALKALEKS